MELKLGYADGGGSSKEIWPYISSVLWRDLGTWAMGLDIGCSQFKVLSSAIGVDQARGRQDSEEHPINLQTMGREGVNLLGDAADLYWFRDNVMDYVFSSHCLEHMEKEKALEGALPEWMRVLRSGGYLFLYLPDGRVIQADTIHAWHPIPEEVMEVLKPLSSDIGLWVPREKLNPWELVGWLKSSFLIVAVK